MALDINKANPKNEECVLCILFAKLLRKKGKLPCEKCKNYKERQHEDEMR